MIKGRGYQAILALGLVSLFGDLIYEGSRGLIPEYLRFLGSSAVIVGIVTGAGEFIAYALRLTSGWLADTTRQYWLLTFLGYGLIVGIPLLALAHSWQLALVFILLERLGKAIRTPARDVILSVASKGVGSGKAFGVHEFMDQVGAIGGPLLVALLIAWRTGDYAFTFGALAIPYILMWFFLLKARRTVGEMRIRRKETGKKDKEKAFFFYLGAVGLNTLGLVPAALILYKLAGITGAAWMVPVVYAAIQGVDAPSALISGYGYDRVGRKFLLLPFTLSVIPSITAITMNTFEGVLLAALSFGLVLGMQESIYRAAVADLVREEKRGRAYGIFHTVYGACLLGAGMIFGWILDTGIGISMALPYVCGLQAAAIILLLKVV